MILKVILLGGDSTGEKLKHDDKRQKFLIRENEIYLIYVDMNEKRTRRKCSKKFHL